MRSHTHTHTYIHIYTHTYTVQTAARIHTHTHKSQTYTVQHAYTHIHTQTYPWLTPHPPQCTTAMTWSPWLREPIWSLLTPQTNTQLTTTSSVTSSETQVYINYLQSISSILIIEPSSTRNPLPVTFTLKIPFGMRKPFAFNIPHSCGPLYSGVCDCKGVLKRWPHLWLDWAV